MRAFSKCLICLASALPLASCEEQQETPVTQVFVLVDLSQTWAGEQFAKRNLATLTEIGEGIADASFELEPPISIQYRIIGANSLEREPICDALFRPRLAPTKDKADYEVGDRSDLRSFLATDCVTKLMKQDAEPLTEIRTAVASVANQPAAGAVQRELIIISDFLEETQTPAAIDSDLSSFHAILVYRPVAQDLNDATTLRFRLNNWKAELEAHGARADIVPDTGIRRSTIASFLTQGRKS